MYIPDNYDAFEAYEAEQERLERRQRRETKEIDYHDLPFYYDPQTHIELGGKFPWKKKQF